MNISFVGYTGEIRIVFLIFCKDHIESIIEQNYNYLYVDDSRVILGPEEKELTIENGDISQLYGCCEFDIFYISAKGRLIKFSDYHNDDVTFMLTAHCNSNCVMCPATDAQRKNNDFIGIKEYVEIVRYMSVDTKHITITGGEPFLVGDSIFLLLSSMRDRLVQTEFLLLTNGRALAFSQYMLQFMESAPENIIVGIPLHGYNAGTHDSITRSPGGFNQTLLGIKRLLKNNYMVEIRIVVSKLNYEYLDKIAELIVSEMPSVMRVEIMGLEMLGNAAVNSQSVWLPYRDAFIHAKKAIDILAYNSITVGLYNFPLCAIDKEYRTIAHKSITDYKIKYMPECELCSVKDACGGIFQGTIRLAGKDVRPVE